MMKKILLVLLTCVFGMSLFVLAACSGENTYKTDYKEENGGSPAESSENFYPDGVLNEEMYASVRWLKNYALDAEDLPGDADRVKTLAAEAAEMNMTVFFTEGGMYAAAEVTNAEGTAAYVNEERAESLNSGVELLFKNYKVKLSPAGKFFWEKRTEGVWAAYDGAQDCLIGAKAQGAPVNDAKNSGYTVEFFLPASAMSGMGLDAAALADGSASLPLDAVLVTSYGQQDTAAARWEMSSLSSWDSLCEFGKDGALVYDISVEISGAKGDSAVAEAALRDYALPQDDTTLLVKEGEGYRLRSLTVNDTQYEVQYDGGSFENGYIILRSQEVNEDIVVKAVFEKNLPVAFETSAETVRFGEKTALDGVSVIFEGKEKYEFAAKEGKLAGKLPRGVYRVRVSDGLYEPQTVAFDGESMDVIRFSYRAFASDKFGDGHGGYHDYSRVNGGDGVITNIDGNSFFPVTNEAFGDSALTATFDSTQMSKSSRLGIRYIWNEKTNAKGMRNAVFAEMNMKGGALYAGFADDYSDNWNNFNLTNGSGHKNKLPDAFAEAFSNGSGVSLTVVRTGARFDIYASLAGDEASRIYVTGVTVGNETLAGMDGHWAVYIWDSANGIEVPVSLEGDASAWQAIQYTVKDETAEDALGKVSFAEEGTILPPVTFTFTPDEGCALLSFKINGEEYISRVQDNALTISENVPIAMTVAAVFGVENYTIKIDRTSVAGKVLPEDVQIVFAGGESEVYTRYDETADAWIASLKEGKYDYSLRVCGYEIEHGSVDAKADGVLELEIAAADLSLTVAEQKQNGTGDLLGALGSPKSFVYSGYLGLEGDKIENVSRFAAETRFTFENGDTMELQFVRWDGAYEIKFMINDQNNGISFKLTDDDSVFDRVKKDSGVWFTVSVQNGVASAWAKNSDGEWVRLHADNGAETWDGVPDDSPIVKAEFRKRYDGNGNNYAVLKEAKLELCANEPEL